MQAIFFLKSILKWRLALALFVILSLIGAPTFSVNADRNSDDGMTIEVGPVVLVDEGDSKQGQSQIDSMITADGRAALDTSTEAEETFAVQNRLIVAGSTACIEAQRLPLAIHSEEIVADITLAKQDRAILVINTKANVSLTTLVEEINALACDDLTAIPDYLTIGERLISIGSGGGLPVSSAPATSLAEQWSSELIGDVPNRPNGNNTQVFVFDAFCDVELPDHVAITTSIPGGEEVNLCGHGHAVQDVIQFMAPKAEIHPVRVLDDHLVTSLGTLIIELDKKMNDVLAERNNLKRTVWNLSLSVNTKRKEIKSLQYMLKEIHKNKGVIVAASGNKGKEKASFPARYNFVVSIGAIGTDGHRTAYSNQGEIYAPGGNGKCRANPESCLILADPNSETGYSYYSGTSFAAPFGSGLVTLIQQKGLRNPNKIRQHLYSATDATNDVIHVPTILDTIP